MWKVPSFMSADLLEVPGLSLAVCAHDVWLCNERGVILIGSNVSVNAGEKYQFYSNLARQQVKCLELVCGGVDNVGWYKGKLSLKVLSHTSCIEK